MSLLKAAGTSAVLMSAGDVICQTIQARKPVAEAMYAVFYGNILVYLVWHRPKCCDAATKQKALYCCFTVTAWHTAEFKYQRLYP